MSTPKTSSSPKFRTWRLVVPILLAAFGALMCAGPGSVAAPGTVVLFERIACPAGAHAGIPTVAAEANPQVQAVYCVQEGAEPRLATGEFFGVAFGIYFFALLVPLLLIGVTMRFGPATVRALSPQAEEELKRMIIAGRQVEAISVVQKRLSLSRRAARDYVQGLIDSLKQTPAPAGIVAAPEVKQQPLATVIERLRQLKELLDNDMISDEEYDAKRFDILEAL